jgi:pyridoxine 4-dehydrogenase
MMTNRLSRRALLVQMAAATSTILTASAQGAQKRVRILHPHLPAGASGSVWIGGDLQVNRIGLGTAEFTGPDRWGEPTDPAAIRSLLRRAVELGVNFIDTADVYGPYIAEKLIYEALYPYPPDLVIATKGGQTHDVRGEMNKNDGHPEHLRAACEGSLKRLKLERIPLYLLHSPDSSVPYEDSIGELGRLQTEGKIRHIGVSQVDAALLAKARSIVKVVLVQNQLNILSRKSDEILTICEREHMIFISNSPLGRGQLETSTDSKLVGLRAVAEARHIDIQEAALAWLLARSPVLMAIPGTTRIDHLESNVKAAGIKLSRSELERIG